MYDPTIKPRQNQGGRCSDHDSCAADQYCDTNGSCYSCSSYCSWCDSYDGQCANRCCDDCDCSYCDDDWWGDVCNGNGDGNGGGGQSYTINYIVANDEWCDEIEWYLGSSGTFYGCNSGSFTLQEGSHVLNLMDNYGDGWQGGELQLCVGNDCVCMWLPEDEYWDCQAQIGIGAFGISLQSVGSCTGNGYECTFGADPSCPDEGWVNDSYPNGPICGDDCRAAGCPTWQGVPYSDVGAGSFTPDGMCDPQCNNFQCGYDQGDCCPSTCVPGLYNTCGTPNPSFGITYQHWLEGRWCADPNATDFDIYNCMSYPANCENGGDGNGDDNGGDDGWEEPECTVCTQCCSSTQCNNGDCLCSNNICWRYLRGDVNNDGIVNVVDLVSLVQFALEQSDPLNYIQEWNSDMNNDGIINVVDVVTLVNVILSRGGGYASPTEITNLYNTMKRQRGGFGSRRNLGPTGKQRGDLGPDGSQ